MMPETASVDNVEHPAASDSSSDDLTPPPDDVSETGLSIFDGFAELDSSQDAGADAPRTNGYVSELNGDDADERPAKRRRTQDATPPPLARKPKLESPPWKRIEAEGPTSYTENGRRKSGRINTLPSERPTPVKRRAMRHSVGSDGSALKKLEAPVSKLKSAPRDRLQALNKKASTPKLASKKSAPELRSSTRPRRRSPSPQTPASRHSTRPRRASRFADSETKASHETRQGHYPGYRRTPWGKLIPRDIPLVHPDQVRKRPKLGVSFEDFWARAGGIPVEEGGLQASEDGPPYTDELAQKEARLILRVEHQTEPGGLLSQERCSLFAPEEAEEPPRQWARQDHLVKAMANFRRLLLAEQQRHRSTAKKLADACREEWLRRQPKSVEEIEAEERQRWLLRYRLVVRVLLGTWENVKAQVNRQRLEQWQAEEQRRVKAALNEAVSLSEQKLQARQGGLDSEIPSDEDGFGDLSDSGSAGSDNDSGLVSDDSDGPDVDSDNMSSTDDDEVDEKDAADEGLTQEQLQAKYAHLPELEAREDETTTTDAAMDAEVDTSDESVDMDDDLESSDGEGDEDDEDESEEGSDEEAGTLLGLFFGKSELRKMQEESRETMPSHGDDAEMPQGPDPDPMYMDGEIDDDDDAMSLVRMPESPDADSTDDKHGSTPGMEASKATSADGNVERPESDHGEGDRRPDDQAEKVADVPAPDAAMADVAPDDPDVEDATERPASPMTEPATNPPSLGRSQSPPTPDTRPSEMDTSMTDLAVAEAVNSPSVPSHQTAIPFLLRGTLREYQHHGLDWLAGLYANNTNGILADEMGLGKTIQTIALLAHLACHHEVWGPHLVIVPTSVMLNWEMEFKKWCPGFKILAYYGSQEERKRKRQGWNNDDIWNVCITSYQLVLQDQQVFRRRRWHYMILDEAHNIKNFKSQRWQTLLGFNTRARLLLTGTPLQNNLTELWSLLFFLMPAENGVGGFADLQEFQDWFHRPETQILESGREQMDDEAKAIISKLHKVLRPYLLRRLKADVEKQMPAKYEHVEFCRLSKRQRELYDGFLSRNDTKETLASGNYMSIINCLMQLRKVCNHPDLFVDRPIMTSFRMSSSVAANYETAERRVRGLLATTPMSEVSLGFLNLVPTEHERFSTMEADRIAQLSSHRALMDLREVQKRRAQSSYMNLDPSTAESTMMYLEAAARWGRFEELQHCVYLNALRRQQKPIYGKNVVDLLTIEAHRRPCRPRPKVPRKVMAWFEDDSTLIRAMMPSLLQRADQLKTTMEKFSCATPAVVTRDLECYLLGRKGVEAFTEEDLRLSAPVRWAPFMPKEAPADPWHEARMRLSIQFPDKRLLQYDCGKLQVLDKLLRKLQAGGHRALIFTQMTKVLDILELFLNIHGHKYLRLDGATKVEQRQILTDRFNNDTRILCFILSTRSGGLGINLTGADTVIFYDQDWNPAMDKQCQDRCHRIGQTRDVHIYRLVSEHTIEANILRKASQKQMLDDVVIQEGEFTTDRLHRMSVRDALEDKVDFTSEGLSAADAALDRVLGGPDGGHDQRVGRVLEQAEDREDVAAARVAEKEIQADEADFTERPNGPASGASTTRQGTPAKSAPESESAEADESVEHNAWGGRVRNIDEYMLAVMAEELKGTKLELPRDKKKGKKKGKDSRKR
ncbi:helicase SWR1 [Drechmeria coniospora]|uniref:DNA helicase n=1 Tax=Drechmeria coniospora TaxID=98403 RepID=A0A151GG62_DRECN|nr:helicase SWR1 [Drechmeria coniospora]KYK56097.1 helicase SWR1 [Drechmeria coniospora]